MTHGTAIYVDLENVAIGAADARYGTFDIGAVERGVAANETVRVRRAYADWTSFSEERRALSLAGYRLIDVPHHGRSAKNSADIELIVDAMDDVTSLPVDKVVLVSGDSDFAPLALRLRERGVSVTGVSVRDSAGKRLERCCDAFHYYDDLIGLTGSRAEKEALHLVVDIARRLLRRRDGDVWASMVKQRLKQKHPDFDERSYGYRRFGELIEEAAERGLLDIELDSESGGHRIDRAIAVH